MTDVLGWAGSALLVYSLLQGRVLRFRLLNLAAAAVLVVFNAAVAVWPMAAVNAVIAVINAVHVTRLLRSRHDDRRYEVVPIGPQEPYLQHLLDRHRRDIERYNPGAGPAPGTPGERLAFLVLSEGATVGMVLAHRTGPDEVQVDLDYVLPPYRDFTPGEFVYRADGAFARQGVRRLVAPPRMREAERYLADVGFRPHGDDLVLDLVLDRA